MVPAARWLLVLAVAVGLVAAPAIARAWPVAQSDLDAAALADAVRASAGTGWSGEVRSQGSVEIPESDSQLDGVARLLGESSTLRVWWRSPDEFRIDSVRQSGETDTVRDGGTTVRWRYEGNLVTYTPFSNVRLPDDPDVVPVALARRMLAGVADSELQRLPERRVAGRGAAGLRIVPDDPRSTIARVDLWADLESGVPLRVEVYAEGETTPALASEVTELHLRRPTDRQTSLDLGDSVRFARGIAVDPDGVLSVYSRANPLEELAGLPRRSGPELGHLGVYGRGPTAMAATPVRDSVARGLREQLRKVRTVTDTGRRQVAAFGPLSVALTRAGGEGYLLVGTVTPATLSRAADEIEARYGDRDGGR